MNKENKRQRQLLNQEVQKITEEEVKAAMKRMTSREAVVSDYIPVEGLKCLGERAVNKRGEEECAKVYKMVVTS